MVDLQFLKLTLKIIALKTDKFIKCTILKGSDVDVD